ncbi:hypothetical protein [Desulfobulbus oligotrophicus]|jgi:DnaJ-class molecular chaperone|uniref:Molecular chaperone DnaJ n=1 Tax=Desulfobulbus oligotrophicus TaxID=1909699 RepID=A0A7T5VEN9_9BACT|nr:hypothetical protein [Desulfobulbus oligotrophicus]MDY0390161.1 hypothetical protein [Desulfobulbus oligotrophicus]QQG66392.1 hypothetical protein HP555_11190 [Desulfobulbus oligotrophicus]
MKTDKKVCNTCGGSGEIGFFQGESRFFVTREECPACCGVGSVFEDSPDPDIQSTAESEEGGENGG